MTNELNPLPSTILPDPPLPPSAIQIRTFSYEERRVIFPALLEALDMCGCWLLDRRAISFTQMEFQFEVQLRSVLDLYGALIAAGLEFTRETHQDLTSLCTLRHHQAQPSSVAGVAMVSLHINFLEDFDPVQGASAVTAFA